VANYSNDAEMFKVDRGIVQWLGSRADFSEVRDVVTGRINGAVKKAGTWPLLESIGATTTGGMVDKDSLLNPLDLEDLENIWVREILYFENLEAAEDVDSVFLRARELRRERIRRMLTLELLVDSDGDGNAEETVRVGKLLRA